MNGVSSGAKRLETASQISILVGSGLAWGYFRHSGSVRHVRVAPHEFRRLPTLIRRQSGVGKSDVLKNPFVKIVLAPRFPKSCRNDFKRDIFVDLNRSREVSTLRSLCRRYSSSESQVPATIRLSETNLICNVSGWEFQLRGKTPTAFSQR